MREFWKEEVEERVMDDERSWKDEKMTGCGCGKVV
jgi:hypothetical protein